MKQVNALSLLASPEDTGNKTEIAGEVGHIYSDGSVIVPAPVPSTRRKARTATSGRCAAISTPSMASPSASA